MATQESRTVGAYERPRLPLPPRAHLLWACPWPQVLPCVRTGTLGWYPLLCRATSGLSQSLSQKVTTEEMETGLFWLDRAPPWGPQGPWHPARTAWPLQLPAGGRGEGGCAGRVMLVRRNTVAPGDCGARLRLPPRGRRVPGSDPHGVHICALFCRATRTSPCATASTPASSSPGCRTWTTSTTA